MPVGQQKQGWSAPKEDRRPGLDLHLSLLLADIQGVRVWTLRSVPQSGGEQLRNLRDPCAASGAWLLSQADLPVQGHTTHGGTNKTFRRVLIPSQLLIDDFQEPEEDSPALPT